VSCCHLIDGRSGNRPRDAAGSPSFSFLFFSFHETTFRKSARKSLKPGKRYAARRAAYASLPLPPFSFPFSPFLPPCERRRWPGIEDAFEREGGNSGEKCRNCSPAENDSAVVPPLPFLFSFFFPLFFFKTSPRARRCSTTPRKNKHDEGGQEDHRAVLLSFSFPFSSFSFSPLSF